MTLEDKSLEPRKAKVSLSLPQTGSSTLCIKEPKLMKSKLGLLYDDF